MSSNTSSANAMVEMANGANQANKAMQAASDAIPDEAKSYMKSAKEKFLDNDKLRPFKVFVGYGEEGAFNVSLYPAVLFPRLKNNLFFYYLNYILLAAVVFAIMLVATMLNPINLVIAGILAVAWFIVMRTTSEGSIEIACITITRKNASFLMTIVSGLMAFFMMKSLFFVTLASGSALSLIHALFRDSSKQKSEDNEQPLAQEEYA